MAGVIGTAGCVGLWGYLLYQGVVDPLGGVKSLWPLFGISNQMLAAVALILVAVILAKMQRFRYMWVPVLPAIWLILCTSWAIGLKLFSSHPEAEGFLFMARLYKQKMASNLAVTPQQMADMQHIVINNYTNAILSVLFLIVVYSILFYGIRTCICCRVQPHQVHGETPYINISEVENRPH